MGTIWGHGGRFDIYIYLWEASHGKITALSIIPDADYIKLQNWSTCHHVNCILPKDTTNFNPSSLPFDPYVIQHMDLNINS